MSILELSKVSSKVFNGNPVPLLWLGKTELSGGVGVGKIGAV